MLDQRTASRVASVIIAALAVAIGTTASFAGGGLPGHNTGKGGYAGPQQLGGGQHGGNKQGGSTHGHQDYHCGRPPNHFPTHHHHSHGYPAYYVWYPQFAYRPWQTSWNNITAPRQTVVVQQAPAAPTVFPAAAPQAVAAAAAAAGLEVVPRAAIAVPVGSTLRLTTAGGDGAAAGDVHKVVLRIKSHPRELEMLDNGDGTVLVELPALANRRPLEGRLELYDAPRTLRKQWDIVLTPSEDRP